jgi:penicillin amidase
VPLDVAVTRHGPIITPLVPGQKAQLALRWTALSGGHTLDAVLALDRARDWDSFRAALADFDSPTLHVCYADADGHVGYALAGALPDRAGGHDGRLPVPGWLGEHEWRGLVAPERNPSFADPPGGLVVNANDRAVSERGTIGYDGEHDPGFRAGRLRELLDPLRGASVERYREVQTDLASVPARRLRETILSLRPRSPLAAAAQALVREWDGELRADSAAAAVYEAWLVRMLERTFKDKLGDELYREYLTHGRYPVPALHALVALPSDPQFVELGTGVRGRDEIASLALDDAARPDPN